MAIFKDGAPAASWGFGTTDQNNRLNRGYTMINQGSHVGGTGIFTVPSGHAGTYFASVSFMTNNPGTGTAHIGIRKNGTQISNGTKAYTTGTLYDSASCLCVVALSDGDTIDFYVTGPKQIHPDYGTCNVYMMY